MGGTEHKQLGRTALDGSGGSRKSTGKAAERTHHLDLLQNSLSFFREAVACVQRDDEDGAHWKFAVVNLVQAMELALKAALERIHPVFILDNIDLPDSDKTFSVSKALKRLQSEHIGNCTISKKEERPFHAAIKLRNRFVHHECSFHAEHVEAQFASLFAFMLFFYEDHLHVGREDIISEEAYAAIYELKKAKDELLRRAIEHIKENDFGDIWVCPDCIEDTFIVDDGKCCLCGYRETVTSCSNCGERIFEYQEEDIFELFDYTIEEGRAEVHDRFGYESRHACEHCIDQIKEDIQNKKWENRCAQMEEEEYYNRNAR